MLSITRSPHYVVLFPSLFMVIYYNTHITNADIRDHNETIHPLLRWLYYRQFSTHEYSIPSFIAVISFPKKNNCKFCEHIFFTVAVMRNTSKETEHKILELILLCVLLHLYISQKFQLSSQPVFDTFMMEHKLYMKRVYTVTRYIR
jgi:hypothetical protein